MAYLAKKLKTSTWLHSILSLSYFIFFSCL
uniref:Uncharacterized protein n=1 Tax=Anguilla anguilla TaxID=7936 RepID=A0A0E9QIY1_ANGAN